MASSTIKTLIILVIAGILCVFVWNRNAIVTAVQPASGKISGFTAINIDGGKTTYQAQKGKATFIVLSASWCPACMAEIPMLKKLHQEFDGQGLKILMVNEDDNVKTAAKFKKKYNLPWTMVHWNYNLMNQLGNPNVIPVSYLVNEQDSIVQVHTGIFDENDLKKTISKLLK